MKRLIHSLLMIAYAITNVSIALAEDIYVTQAGSGAQTGSSVSSAKSRSWFDNSANWGIGPGKISPGDTVHVAGTFTNLLAIRGNGEPGAHVTLLFEPDAKIEYGVQSGNGAITLLSRKFITIDGGLNGYIGFTNNGTLLGSQVAAVGVYGSGVSEITIRNLTISNIYVRVANSSDSHVGGTGISLSGSMTNVQIYSNKVYEVETGINVAYNINSSNIQIFGNALDRISNGIQVGNSANGVTSKNIVISDNRISGGYKWDGSWTPPPGDGHFHTDGIHVFAMGTGTRADGVKICRNIIGPDMGTHVTGWIYIEGSNTNVFVFNNLLFSEPPHFPSNGYIVGSGDNAVIYNNTIAGWGKGSGVGFKGGKIGMNLHNNIFYNIDTPIFLNATGTLTSSRNLFFGFGNTPFYHRNKFCTLTEWKALGFDNDAATQEPDFRNASVRDFRLRRGSAAIDNAVDMLPILRAIIPSAEDQMHILIPDKDGISRPQGTGWDLGAHENVGLTSSPSNLRIIQ